MRVLRDTNRRLSKSLCDNHSYATGLAWFQRQLEWMSCEREGKKELAGHDGQEEVEWDAIIKTLYAFAKSRAPRTESAMDICQEAVLQILSAEKRCSVLNRRAYGRRAIIGICYKRRRRRVRHRVELWAEMDSFPGGESTKGESPEEYKGARKRKQDLFLQRVTATCLTRIERDTLNRFLCGNTTARALSASAGIKLQSARGRLRRLMGRLKQIGDVFPR